MNSRNQKLIATSSTLVIIYLVLFLGMAFLTERATAQNPKENKTVCEANAELVAALQDLLVLDVEKLGELNRSYARWDSLLQGFDKKFKSELSGASGEEERATFLETRRSILNTRRGIKNEIETLTEEIQHLKERISNLLKELGACGSKSQTQTPTPSPSPTPSPTPTPTPQSNNTLKNTTNQVGYKVDTKTANGLVVTTFDTPQGKIKVNLTDDIAAGDAISGTVETEPNGKNDAERAQNQAELNGYVVELEGQQTKVGDKKISCNIPNVLTTEAKTIVIQHNGKPVATTEIPISVTPQPTPSQLTLPTGGQQGKPIECLGNFAPTDQVKIDGTILPPIAQSPRKLVVRNTSETIGQTTIKCGRQECPFRNIGIKLSAPKLNLRRGETTTLHVVVTGLAGITQPVPLHLVSNDVISMSGGNTQDLMIDPGQVQQDGTASIDRTLTGNTTGGFGVTATAKWDEVCKHP